jgi:hypothetical protein
MIMNGLMNRKYVKITTNLPKDCDNVIGTPVKGYNDEIVGKVVEYDKETGKATIKIKAAIWKQISCGDTGLLKRLNNVERKDN